MIYIIISAVVIILIMALVFNLQKRKIVKNSKKEIEKYKNMLSDRMELESETLAKLKSDVETIKKENENLRISVQTYSQKPGRKELQRLNVYQTAVDRLIINSPGFGAAWQSALKDSEEEFEKTFIGSAAFVKKLIPMKTDASVLKELE